jgi:gamma-glutamylaminecyclotransferase
MRELLFVYGTLKEGFFNHHINRGERLPGEFVTRQRFPLYLIGPRYLPWLVNAPGEGEHVVGQLYRVDQAMLQVMDELERVGHAGWYERVTITVRSLDDDEPCPLDCHVYLGSQSRADADGVRLGPLPEYTLAHADLFLHSGPLTLNAS